MHQKATYNPRPAATAEGLPDLCYSVLSTDGSVILLRRGVRGYYATDYPKGSDAHVDGLNERMGVTKAQREAMEAGSLFGFHTPAADPANYDASGQWVKA